MYQTSFGNPIQPDFRIGQTVRMSPVTEFKNLLDTWKTLLDLVINNQMNSMIVQLSLV